MSDNGPCPFCKGSLRADNLYLRGVATALLRSDQQDVGIFSRVGLEQIDLRDISRGDVGAQAVIPTLYCESCGAICLKSR